MALAGHPMPLEACALTGGEGRKVTCRQFRFPSSCPSKFCNGPPGDSTDSLLLEWQDEEQKIGFRNEDLGILPCRWSRAGPVGITLLEMKDPKSDDPESTKPVGCDELHGCRSSRMLLKTKERTMNLWKENLGLCFAMLSPCWHMIESIQTLWFWAHSPENRNEIP